MLFVHVCVVIDYANSMSALSMTKQKRVCLFVACEDKSEKFFLAGNLKTVGKCYKQFHWNTVKKLHCRLVV